jgi:hypothetical protein
MAPTSQGKTTRKKHRNKVRNDQKKAKDLVPPNPTGATHFFGKNKTLRELSTSSAKLHYGANATLLPDLYKEIDESKSKANIKHYEKKKGKKLKTSMD